MTDRELLELAAKAAGYEIEESYVGGGERKLYRKGELISWNPLEDDGDALRLAVRLGMSVNVWTDLRDTVVRYGEGFCEYVQEDHFGNAEVVTRHAIVRAAAEIGKESS